MRSIPLWALKKQYKMEKRHLIPKFKPGDIVLVSAEDDHKDRVAVILETPPEGFQNIAYAVDFGPGQGYLAWVDEEIMTLLKRSVA